MKVSMNKADFLQSNLTGVTKEEGNYFRKEYNLFNREKILPKRVGISSSQEVSLTGTNENGKQAEDQQQNNTEETNNIMEIKESIKNKNAEENNYANITTEE
eukprot:3581742-Ditylum_brightwellii.AAC.1